jgi:hypothetical protein
MLSINAPRAITISLEWSRDPGPTENEHLHIALPDIVAAALDAVEKLAEMSEAIQHLVAEGKVCRIGIKDGLFVYGATHAGPSEGASERMSD